MACGTPVIAARTSSIPEVVGDAAVLLDPDDDRVWDDGIERVLEDGPSKPAARSGPRARAGVLVAADGAGDRCDLSRVGWHGATVTPRLSVIVLNYDGREWLEPCLAALAAQVAAPPFEVILADNGSRDGSPHSLPAAFHLCASSTTVATSDLPPVTMRQPELPR